MAHEVALLLTFSKAENLVMDASSLTSIEYVFVGRCKSGVTHIVHNSVIEQNHGLRDDTDPCAKASNMDGQVNMITC